MKLNRLILLLSLTFQYSVLLALDCVSESSIALHSQEEVDNFQMNWGGGVICDTVTGSLHVSGDDLVNLNGLSDLTTIDGNLVLSSDSLPNFVGLSSLQAIGDKLLILNSDGLISLDGFTSLTSIGGGLTIQLSDALQNIDGLSGVSVIGGGILISANPSLNSIQGLSGLSGIVSGNFYLGPSSLTSLDGMSGITGIANNLTIAGSMLTDYSGISNLTSVGGELRIAGNGVITDLTVFSNINYVGRSLTITLNDSLQSLAGLGPLGPSLQSVTISSNNSLPDISGLPGLTTISGSLNISNNASLVQISGLSSITEIGGRLDIQDNMNLQFIDGLAGLQTVDSVYISTNPALVNLDGLRNITAIGSPFLRITFNDSLQNLDGLSSLIEVFGSVSILSNPSLSDCLGIIPLLDDIDDGATGPGMGSIPDVWVAVDLSGNGPACNTVEDVLATEQSTTVFVTKTYSDSRPVNTLVSLECEPSTVIVPVATGIATPLVPAEFEVRRYVPNFGQTCSADEVDLAPGYSANIDNCSRSELTESSSHSCEIINQQDPKFISVTKTYSASTPVNGPEVLVTLSCPSAAISPGVSQLTSGGSSDFSVSEFPWDGESCTITESVPEGYIQLSAEGCTSIEIAPDGKPVPACDFVNEIIGATLILDGFEELPEL